MAYINGNVNVDTSVLLPRRCPVVPFLSRVMPHDKRILGQVFVETFRRRSVDEEV